MKKIIAAAAAIAMAATPLMAFAATNTGMSTGPVATGAVSTVARLATVSLACTTGSGDVARPLYVKNTTVNAVPSGKVISWQLGTAHGQEQLSASLAPGASMTINGPPGSGGVCTATYVK